MTMNSNKYPLWLKAALALAAAGIVAGGTWFYREQEVRLRAAVEAELEAMTDLKSRQIADWRRELLAKAEIMRATLDLGSPKFDLATGMDSEQRRQRLARWLGRLVDSTHFKRALLVDARLDVVLTSAPTTGEAPALNAALRGPVGEAFRTGASALVDLHRAGADGPVQLAVVVPLEEGDGSADGPPQAALVLEIHADDYLYPLLLAWPTPARTAETQLLRRDGDSVLYLNEWRFQANTALNLRVPVTDTHRLAVKTVLGQKGLTHGVDYRGKAVVAMLKAIPDSPWFLVSKLDEAEAFADWRFRSKMIVVLVGGLLISFVGATTAYWQRQTSRQYKKLFTTEVALRASEAHFREVVEAANEGVWEGDPDLRTTFVNKQLEKLLGRRAGEMLGRPLAELLGLEDAGDPASPLAALRQDKTSRFECQVAAAGSAPRWLLISMGIQRNAQASMDSAYGLFTDITALKRAETEMRWQASLLDAANDAIYVRTMEHIVTYWNGGAARLYGYSRAEALGRDIRELGRLDAAEFAAAYDLLLQAGSWTGELRKHNSAGQQIVMFCRWTLLRDAQERPTGILAINRDITEKKQLEEQFFRAQRMESIGALAGGIAHDLNNALAPILMAGSLLKANARDPESLAMLNTVEVCALRGAKIIQQLLLFARGQPTALVPLPLRHLLSEMGEIIKGTFPRQIRLEISVPRDLWIVLADSTQVHQAIMNLSVNARDAMPQGGTLTLAAGNVMLDVAFAATIPNAKPGDYVCVTVSDTGTGIPPEIRDRIFEPFFTTKEVGKGTGLGLPTVLGIARGHGGFVSVDSQPGRGTTFGVYLPASPETQEPGTAFPAAPPPRGRNELILVVDDEPAVRRMLQHMLEQCRYRVLTAAEGGAGLALFTQHRAEIRAVVTDLMMPGMEGPELLRRLRQLDERLPILGMTGLIDRAATSSLEGLGFTALLAKPFTTAKLLAAMHEALAASEVPAKQARASSSRS